MWCRVSGTGSETRDQRRQFQARKRDGNYDWEHFIVRTWPPTPKIQLPKQLERNPRIDQHVEKLRRQLGQPNIFLDRRCRSDKKEQDQMTENAKKNDDPENQIEDPLPVRRLRALIKDRKLTKEFAETDEFQALVSEISKVLHSQIAHTVCSGLSVSSRAASVSKPMEEIFNPHMVECLKTSKPPFVALHDGEDRWYLAKAMQLADPSRVADIAFTEIVREDVGEKARKTWVEIAFAAASSREDLLRQINSSISHVFGAQRSRSNSLARRIRRIVPALKDELILSELPAGPDYGNQLRILLSGHFSDDGPEEKTLREEYVQDSLAVLADVARLSLSISSDPRTYIAVSDMKDWWRPASAPVEVERLGAKLAATGVETLLVFARQGHKNEPLRKGILEAVGRSAFQRLAERTVNLDATLSEEMGTWLVTGGSAKSRHSSEVVDALSTERTNEDVSRLLIYLASAELDSSEITSLSREIEDLMPEQGDGVLEIGKRIKQVSQIVGSMAKRRHLELFGRVGDTVEFDPAQHEPIGEIAIGSNSIVSRPGTRLKEPGRPERILLKPRVRSI